MIETQLRSSGEENFSIIKICPQKHQLVFQDLLLDSSSMISNPLHMYILKEKIVIFQDDIIDEIHVPLIDLSDERIVTDCVKLAFEKLIATLI
ncbi:hypothetical protein [Pedobacter deserti]|uniref:hypothetical protein n=1 Tax=Pedobacter deserti TaxID=2817382 RepID=UPI00210B7940|nr:hypothetical protein [Pedobacter sp. SYSU D00382]